MLLQNNTGFVFVSILIFVCASGCRVHSADPRFAEPDPLTSPSRDSTGPAELLSLKEKIIQHRRDNEREKEAQCLQQMGQLLYHSGNYLQAMEHLFQADGIFRTEGLWVSLASNLNMLGTVYYYNQQQDHAWNKFREALALFKKMNAKAGMAETYGLIGHIYEKQLLYDSAFYFQKMALQFARADSNTAILAKIHENIGSIFEDRAQYDSAHFYFQQSLAQYQKTGNEIDQIEVINNLGDVWSKSGNYARGMEYARKAEKMAVKLGEKYQLQSAYRDIAQNFAGMKKYDSAYLYLENSRKLVQSIYASENSQQIGLMQTLYDIEKKNTRITELNAARKINTALIVAISALLVMLGILAAAIINRQKMKIRTERAVHESNRAVFETQKGLMESELKRQQLEEASLKQQLDIRSGELSSHILHLIQKNEVLEELKQGLTEIVKDDRRDQKKQVRQLLQKINMSFSQDAYWDEFRLIFDQVHPSFMTELQKINNALTPGEIRLLALIKMNLNTRDMAVLLGVTQDSLRVLRYRVKKKLNIGGEASLTSFTQSIG